MAVYNTDTSYSDLLSQHDQHVYYVNTTDTSGFVFEFFNLDVSNEFSVNPTFQNTIDDISGFSDVSAVSMIDVSLVTFNEMFAIQVDSSNIDDLSATDIKYGFNPNFANITTLFDDISFSKSVIKYGNINRYYDNQTIEYDYIRHLSKEITGGLSAVDIFNNESELREHVCELDTSFSSLLNTSIYNAFIDSSGSFKTADQISSTLNYSSLYSSAKSLFTINVNAGDISSVDVSRVVTLFEDISNESNDVTTDDPSLGEITIPLKFHKNDKIALRFTYEQATKNPIDLVSSITIENRSYKILLNLTD